MVAIACSFSVTTRGIEQRWRSAAQGPWSHRALSGSRRSPSHAKWYGKAFGGATFPQNDDTTLNGPGSDDLDFELDYDTGYTLDAAFGAYFTPNIAMELEYAYRRADFKGGDFDDGHTRSNALMLNALYKGWTSDPCGKSAMPPGS